MPVCSCAFCLEPSSSHKLSWIILSLLHLLFNMLTAANMNYLHQLRVGDSGISAMCSQKQRMYLDDSGKGKHWCDYYCYFSYLEPPLPVYLIASYARNTSVSNSQCFAHMRSQSMLSGKARARVALHMLPAQLLVWHHKAIHKHLLQLYQCVY